MSVFTCEDPVGCDCRAHVTWESHVPCSTCCLMPLHDAFGKPLAAGHTGRGRCSHCLLRSWPQSEWVWRHRDFFDGDDLVAYNDRTDGEPAI